MVAQRTLALRLGALRVGEDIRDRHLCGVPVSASDFGCLSENDRIDIKKKMPMPELGLELSEELTVVKAKMRPAVLLYRDCLNERRNATYLSGRGGRAPAPSRHLFAPVYSLRKDNGETDYPPEFIEMVKAGKFPNIVYLPRFRAPIVNESMLVLSDQFLAGIDMVEPTDLAVDPISLACEFSEFEEFLIGMADDLDTEFAK